MYWYTYIQIQSYIPDYQRHCCYCKEFHVWKTSLRVLQYFLQSLHPLPLLLHQHHYFLQFRCRFYPSSTHTNKNCSIFTDNINSFTNNFTLNLPQFRRASCTCTSTSSDTENATITVKRLQRHRLLVIVASDMHLKASTYCFEICKASIYDFFSSWT